MTEKIEREIEILKQSIRDLGVKASKITDCSVFTKVEDRGQCRRQKEEALRQRELSKLRLIQLEENLKEEKIRVQTQALRMTKPENIQTTTPQTKQSLILPAVIGGLILFG